MASLGTSRVIQEGLLRPDAVHAGIMLSFSAAALGLVIVDVARWPILLLALLSLEAAYLYTGGP